MSPKNLHVVFHRVAKETLLRSQAFDPDAIRLICLEDALAIGPLFDMDSDKAYERRTRWLSEVFEEKQMSIDEWVGHDSKAIADILERPGEVDAIYLWTGYCAGEILSAARFVSHAAQLGKPLFQINFPNIPMRIWNGEIIYPESLVVTNPNQVGQLTEHFIPLNDKDMEAYFRIWEKAVSTDSLLRIRDHISARKIRHEQVDYFDHFLQRHCTDEFKKAARVIGETLCDIEMSVGDGFLNWRLKLLCHAGKLAYRGELKTMRDYEIKNR
jgi:hypothetical protein